MSHSFPLTANGKVDVRALPPADDAAAFDDTDAVVGARTPTEMILCDIWSNLLGVWGFALSVALLRHIRHIWCTVWPLAWLADSIFHYIAGKNVINVYANFFDTGGHSLTVAQLISRIRAELQVGKHNAKTNASCGFLTRSCAGGAVSGACVPVSNGGLVGRDCGS